MCHLSSSDVLRHAHLHLPWGHLIQPTALYSWLYLPDSHSSQKGVGAAVGASVNFGSGGAVAFGNGMGSTTAAAFAEGMPPQAGGRSPSALRGCLLKLSFSIYLTPGICR